MNTLAALLVLFQVKHFLCDYPLQTPSMLTKGSADASIWIPALLKHSGVHALGTLFVVAPFAPRLAFTLCCVDLVAHFVVDRIKAAPTLGGRWNPSQPRFWHALGLDQLAHHVINIAFAFIAAGVSQC